MRRVDPWIWLRYFLSLAYLVQTVRWSWLSDDAYITFRTVDNLIGGHGLTWNVLERVQAFTDPLFTLLFACVYAITREAFLLAIVFQVLLAAGAAAIAAWKLADSPRSGALVLVVLICSRAFVDFSTSGLENPLTHLLLAALLWAHFERPRADALIVTLASLLLLNRLDLVLLVAPILISRLRSARAWVGLAPLTLWEAFSLIYYGSLLPNTAAAKLATGIGGSSSRRRGCATSSRSPSSIRSCWRSWSPARR